MDVIAALGATLWKMFAGDLPLSGATLAIIAVIAVAARSGLLAAAEAPLLLGALVLAAFAVAVSLAIRTEISKKDR